MPANVHGDPVKVPLVLVKVTVPDGVMAVPTDVSVTVAVQFAVWPVVIVFGVQVTLVVVVLGLTVTLAVPVLPRWLVSPA